VDCIQLAHGMNREQFLNVSVQKRKQKMPVLITIIEATILSSKKFRFQRRWCDEWVKPLATLQSNTERKNSRNAELEATHVQHFEKRKVPIENTSSEENLSV